MLLIDHVMIRYLDVICNAIKTFYRTVNRLVYLKGFFGEIRATKQLIVQKNDCLM